MVSLWILCSFVMFLTVKASNGIHTETTLSVTDYGALQIAMLRHGEKYATDNNCYRWEDVPPLYHGLTHVRGLQGKQGDILFKVNVPVIIYLAIDLRSSYIHGDDFEKTGDLVMLGGCQDRVKFPIYRSKKVHGPGLVTLSFKTSRLTGIFLRDNAYDVRPFAELKVTFPPGSPREISMVREKEKFATNRKCYEMVDIPPKYYGLTHLRGPNDETTVKFDVNIPVIVYVAIDSRLNRHNILPSTFVSTGEKIVHGGCHSPTDFPIYERKYPNGGTVTIPLKSTRMLTVMVKPLI